MQLSDNPIALTKAEQSTIKPRLLKHGGLEQKLFYKISIQRRPKDELKIIQPKLTSTRNAYTTPTENIPCRKNQGKIIRMILAGKIFTYMSARGCN